MDFHTPNLLALPKDPHTQILIAGAAVVLLIGICFAVPLIPSKKQDDSEPGALVSFLRFCYACFLKPHESGEGGSQQAALESFYKAQAGVYDSTRRALLRGREDMLGLVAAQLVQRAAKDRTHDPKRIWVDVSFIPQLQCDAKLLIFKGRRRNWIQH
jgi:betaine lipid synthase